MSDQLAAISVRLQKLDWAVAEGRTAASHTPWGGAGLVVATALPEAPYEESYKYVATPHAGALSWLVSALWSTFRPVLDHRSKVEFFGRLGNAAHRYQQRAGEEENSRDLLAAVLHEAYQILSDIQSGRFQFLDVAPVGVVHDDFLPDSEHDDALSAAELERWFNDEGTQ